MHTKSIDVDQLKRNPFIFLLILLIIALMEKINSCEIQTICWLTK